MYTVIVVMRQMSRPCPARGGRVFSTIAERNVMHHRLHPEFIVYCPSTRLPELAAGWQEPCQLQQVCRKCVILYSSKGSAVKCGSTHSVQCPSNRRHALIPVRVGGTCTLRFFGDVFSARRPLTIPCRLCRWQCIQSVSLE